MGGLSHALPFVLETEVIILEHETEGTSARALGRVCRESSASGRIARRSQHSRCLKPRVAGTEPLLSQEEQAHRCSIFPVRNAQARRRHCYFSRDRCDECCRDGSLAANRIEGAHSARITPSRRLRSRSRRWRDANSRNHLAPPIRLAGWTDRARARQPAEKRHEPKPVPQACRLWHVAEVSGDEPPVSHPAAGFDGDAGAGLLCGPALHGDGQIS